MSGRRWPLRSMWEAESDGDYDAPHGDGEPHFNGEHTHQCPGCDRQSHCYASGCALPVKTYCGECPLPAGFRYCVQCGALCRPDVTLDPTRSSCSWCSFKARRAAGQHDDEATDRGEPDTLPSDDD